MRSNTTKWHEPMPLDVLAARANNVEEKKDEFEPVRGYSDADTKLRQRIGAVPNNPRDQESYWTRIRKEEKERQAKFQEISAAIEERRKEGILWEV